MQKNENTREAMFSMIRDWQQSGLNQKQYCLQHNIRYHAFHYWYKRFREALRVPESFIQLQPPVSSFIPFAEFSFPGGGRVLFHQPVSTGYLKALAG